MPHGPQKRAFGAAIGLDAGRLVTTGFVIGAAAGGGCAKRGYSCTISMRSGVPFACVGVCGALRCSKSTAVSQPVVATRPVTHKARTFAGSFMADTNARSRRKFYSPKP